MIIAAVSEQQFRPGDKVQYDGAGPIMEVVSVSGGLCYCTWVDEAGQEQHGTYESRKLTRGFADSKPTPLLEN